MVEFQVAISQIMYKSGSELTLADTTIIVRAIEEIRKAIIKHDEEHKSEERRSRTPP